MRANSTKFFLAVACVGLLFTGCHSASTDKRSRSNTDSAAVKAAAIPDSSGFKQKVQGKQVNLFVLKNSNNFQVAITNYGGRIVSMMVPDKDGKLVDVVLGCCR